ncbi:M14 family metallopeptidase [Pelagibaculum spongiae]|uniref:Peptidase n=1 Tax=Pelagibaculum spongiae TaxID=2080658 RepID=A0A2V1GUB4_9GAMM|nr:M14 family metallocarboxypeptidase [Pelagibaculum spongiae]PVZ69676.1 peptidase [Pelagibaculum spongiae]
MTHFYPIGQPNQPWQASEKQAWFKQAQLKREFKTEVIYKLHALSSNFQVSQYGSLPVNPMRYPLYALTSKNWQTTKHTVLITGGVHGYETSGVQGALLFAKQFADQYIHQFNLIILPCISPWGYETINRWNANAIDPNRSFYVDSPCEEAAQAMAFVASLDTEILAHIDLHETTDSDEDEFRPALAARDGITYQPGSIPDGFYLVGDSENPQPEFQKAILQSVQNITYIAPTDSNGQIIGSAAVQPGVINYSNRTLGLCAGFSENRYCSTTEVYPDSPNVTEEQCNLAQVAAVTGALDYLLNRKESE